MVKTTGNPDSRSNRTWSNAEYEKEHGKIYAERYINVRLQKSPYTLPQTQKASKVAALDNFVLRKYGHKSGTDLYNHEDEFIQRFQKSGIGHLNQKDSEELEDKNFHTALDILRKHNLADAPR